MGKTVVGIDKRDFLINGKKVYSEIPGSNPASHGLLWNQRMIQGVFDDAGHRERYSNAVMKNFDPERNTDNLIAALPEWYGYGLRAITVCFQGGWPVDLIDVREIDNNPFGADGLTLDPAYAGRMDRIIRAADEIGMVVIVNYLYWAQSLRLRDGKAVRNAVITASRFLRDGKYTNVLVDVANEYNIKPFSGHPIAHTAEGMVSLIELAREHSGGIAVGASGGGGMIDKEVAQASDYVLIHGNGLTRGQYHDFLVKTIGYVPDKPILCNEDSPCLTRVDVALAMGTSWGYYNNYTKQIPACDFGVTAGEDLFFARRMARAVGIPVVELPEGERFVLQGLSPAEAFGDGLHCLRLAAEYPEFVDHVVFLHNGVEFGRSYDEPFFYRTATTWLGTPFHPEKGEYTARVVLVDGTILEKRANIE